MFGIHNVSLNDDEQTSFLGSSQVFSGNNEPLDLSCALVDLQKKSD